MNIAVIGGGAAGLIAAVFAKRANRRAEVTVFEKNDRTGRKLLSTGNGRCNLTNTEISAANYVTHSPDFVEKALENRGYGFVRDFFAGIGVPFTIEEGRAYPVSMRAAAVSDALRFEALRRGAEIETNSAVTEISFVRGRFTVKGRFFDKVILACGGKAAPALGTDGGGFEMARALGHKVYSVYPALVQLRTENPPLSLKGIRARAAVSAVVHGEIIRRERGEVQFTDYGLSGIPIMQLSSLFEGSMEISIDLFPDRDFSSLVDELIRLGDSCGDLPLPVFMGGYLHKNLTRLVCARARVDASKAVCQLTARELKAFVSAGKGLKFSVTGTNSWASAQTTRGGVDLKEIYPETMGSRLLGGLYFAGEITDVCGDCGGYNLHWAWITGAAAGENAGKE